MHHALRQQAIERLGDINQTAILEGFGEKARIEQMENGVLNATHVLLHWKPAVDGVFAERPFCVVWIGKTQVVPGGAHEGVHRVRFPFGRFAAGGTRHVHPVLVLRQWRTSPAGEIDVAR